MKSLEEIVLLIKGASETIEIWNEAKEQKGAFFAILLGTLSASLLGNLLVGKGIIQPGEGCYLMKMTDLVDF